MKKIPNWLIVAVFLTLLIASKFIFFAKKEDKKTSAAKGEKPPIAVNYFVVKPMQFSNDVFATGKIGAFNQIDLMPEISGKVTNIYFSEGQSVNKGDVLVKINDADLQAQLLKVKTQIQLSEQKLERLKKLFAINGVSQEEVDTQQNELDGFKADQAYIQAQINKATITAPFSGILGLKNISEGSFVSPTTAMVSLVQVKPLYIEFSVPEKYKDLLKKGVNLTFSAETEITSQTYSASIYAIEPTVDVNTKTIRTRAVYNGNQQFFAGGFVKVYVNLGETKDALMIPTQCVIPTLKGQKVFLSKNNIAVEVPVTIGIRNDEKIQILDGISVGDTVVTTGLLSVKKDSKLVLTKASK